MKGVERINYTMIEKKIKKIIADNIDIQTISQDIGLEFKLADIGVNSISFIKIIVSIETEFGFEFSDEDLVYNIFPTLESLVSYVRKVIE